MDFNEQKLIRKLKKGDQAAFEELLAQNEKRIYNLSYKMLGNREDAEDALQETFLKAYSAIDGFKGNSRLSTWLHTIASNVCMDILRKRRPELFTSIDDNDDDARDLISEIPDISPGPEEKLLRTELRISVNNALQKLPADAKEILLLREISGLSYAEIAIAKGLEEGTVKSRIFRARKKLAEILSSDGNFSELNSSTFERGGGKA